MTLDLTRRLVKGSPLTADEHDENLDVLEEAIEAAGLTGPQGPQGPAGPTGATGSSAYQTAVSGGFVGTEAQWLASLVGPQGPTGPTGPEGPAGAQGPAGVVAATAPVTYDAGTQTVGISVGTTAGTVAAGDDARLSTNLSYDAGTRVLASSTGDDATLPVVSTSAAGLAPATGFATLAYAASVAVDFAALDGQVQTITLTDALELTSSNLAAGRRTVIRLLPGASQRSLTFPIGWVFVSTKPANIAANKSGILSLTAFGATDADVIAAWAVQP